MYQLSGVALEFVSGGVYEFATIIEHAAKIGLSAFAGTVLGEIVSDGHEEEGINKIAHGIGVYALLTTSGLALHELVNKSSL